MPDDEKIKNKVPQEIDYKKKYEELKELFIKFIVNIEGTGFQIQLLSKNQYTFLK